MFKDSFSRFKGPWCIKNPDCQGTPWGSCKFFALIDLDGQLYSAHNSHGASILQMICSLETCQNKVSSDQYNVANFQAHV